MVAGMFQDSPSAMLRMVPRSILPERVLGRRSTTAHSLNAATGPMRSRTSATASATMSAGARLTPAFSTSRPSGNWPFMASATPITAHSATSGWSASTSSMAPVDRRWPATLITSSVRAMTNT